MDALNKKIKSLEQDIEKIAKYAKDNAKNNENLDIIEQAKTIENYINDLSTYQQKLETTAQEALLYPKNLVNFEKAIWVDKLIFTENILKKIQTKNKPLLEEINPYIKHLSDLEEQLQKEVQHLKRLNLDNVVIKKKGDIVDSNNTIESQLNTLKTILGKAEIPKDSKYEKYLTYQHTKFVQETIEPKLETLYTFYKKNYDSLYKEVNKFVNHGDDHNNEQKYGKTAQSLEKMKKCLVFMTEINALRQYPGKNNHKIEIEIEQLKKDTLVKSFDAISVPKLKTGSNSFELLNERLEALKKSSSLTEEPNNNTNKNQQPQPPPKILLQKNNNNNINNNQNINNNILENGNKNATSITSTTPPPQKTLANTTYTDNKTINPNKATNNNNDNNINNNQNINNNILENRNKNATSITSTTSPTQKTLANTTYTDNKTINPNKATNNNNDNNINNNQNINNNILENRNKNATSITSTTSPTQKTLANTTYTDNKTINPNKATNNNNDNNINNNQNNTIEEETNAWNTIGTTISVVIVLGTVIFISIPFLKFIAKNLGKKSWTQISL